MKNRTLFKEDATGRFFMANKEYLQDVLQGLVKSGSTMGGVALVLSDIGGMPLPSRRGIEYMNRFKLRDFEFIDVMTEDDQPCIEIAFIHE